MKRLLFLSLAVLLTCLPAYAQKREPGKVKTLVIDPGHGGIKPGAISKDLQEKELTLAVALRFGSLVEKHMPDVKVIYTRKTDVDITLAERANIANRNKADLFISIHANSHPKSEPSGVETFVMGLSQSKANLEVAKKENADILLESDYATNNAYQGFDPNSPESYVMFAMYQSAYLSKSLDFANYIQSQYKSSLRSINRGVKQAELFVIYKTAMPAVLTEIGFVSNPEERAFLLSDAGREKIAVCLYNAFASYKAHEEGTQPKLISSFNAPVADTDITATKTSDKVSESEKAKQKAEEEARALAAQKEAEEHAMAEAAQKKEAEEQAALKAKEEEAAKEAEAKALAAKEAAEAEAKERAKEQERQADEANRQAQAAAQMAAANPHNVSYRIQFLRSDQMLKAGDKQLKGLDNFTYYKQDGIYCYMWGSTTSLEAAKVLQSDVRNKGFRDAFVVAFANGERVSLQKAKQLLLEGE
ncbi:MAG: N-acetylmuramoyl-L-alanine amidase [Bacteroidales bacterium]|nr:N-acetylmuramoyl-L-alanine amidase [Bacteroidales bacterium]